MPLVTTAAVVCLLFVLQRRAGEPQDVSASAAPRRCASPGCPYLIKGSDRCPLHRTKEITR